MVTVSCGVWKVEPTIPGRASVNSASFQSIRRGSVLAVTRGTLRWRAYGPLRPATLAPIYPAEEANIRKHQRTDRSDRIIRIACDETLKHRKSPARQGFPVRSNGLEPSRGKLCRDEPLDEVERGLRDLLPAVVDGERVAAIGHLLDLGDALVALLPLVGRVGNRPGNRVVLLPVEDQQRAPIWVLRVDLRLGPGVDVGVAHLGQGDPRPGHVVGVVKAVRLVLIESVRPAVLELVERECDRPAARE